LIGKSTSRNNKMEEGAAVAEWEISRTIGVF